MRLLVVDTETSGTEATLHGLLSVGMVVWENGVIGDTEEVLVRPASWHVIDPRAMEINEISLEDHNKIAVDATTARFSLDKFIIQHFDTGLHSPRHAQLVGHNVSFDVSFLKQLYKPEDLEWWFGYRHIDTMSLAAGLRLAGKLNVESLSLDSLIKHYGIAVSKRHSALGDALATAELLTKLIEDIRNPSTVSLTNP